MFSYLFVLMSKGLKVQFCAEKNSKINLSQSGIGAECYSKHLNMSFVCIYPRVHLA